MMWIIKLSYFGPDCQRSAVSSVRIRVLAEPFSFRSKFGFMIE